MWLIDNFTVLDILQYGCFERIVKLLFWHISADFLFIRQKQSKSLKNERNKYNPLICLVSLFPGKLFS